ncbi:MAG: radical SAM protein [Bacteroidales bacterium]|nr:radical SAM protein [Bacteroidales bacterium]
MTTFLFDKIIFGPVKSRRLGISLGINLLPVDSKLCNFNCIYCECGWTPGALEMKISWHARQLVAEKLEATLQSMKEKKEPLDVITYAGNGEPTMHPEFEGIIDNTITIRNKYYPNARIAVLSNATLLHKVSVFRALNRVDDNILKLDSVFLQTIELFNKPLGKFRVEKIIEQLKQFDGNVIIQTMFVKGSFGGEKVDNTTEKELTAWIKALHQIKPKQVMIYTIARDTPSPDLEKVSLDDLNKIKDRLEGEGFRVQVSG